ncbi:Electron transport complex subunit RsxB [bioreactor metagenome]|uniref:Electron transport complex subunit RsxB n=1 Tax=bioreactor metagenome TaxID=1076179 RepID=A0A644TSC8_9ZZZZ|nr:4Fe-4S binding protein [Negativicutes bacterium]
MLRKIVEINEEKCNGCGLCIGACHEAAIELINGKAKLRSDNLCDGLGACLPDCPTGAIRIIEREAAAFDEDAVKQHIASSAQRSEQVPASCPGSAVQELRKRIANRHNEPATSASALRQWPCQLQLVPVNAPYFNNAHLLVAADCSAFAYANLHDEFMRDRVTVIGCPKLDNVKYAAKLTEILQSNNIKSVTVVRMEVPCCGGIENAVKEALGNSNKMIPWRVVTIGIDGAIREDSFA